MTIKVWEFQYKCNWELCNEREWSHFKDGFIRFTNGNSLDDVNGHFEDNIGDGDHAEDNEIVLLKEVDFDENKWNRLMLQSYDEKYEYITSPALGDIFIDMDLEEKMNLMFAGYQAIADGTATKDWSNT